MKDSDDKKELVWMGEKKENLLPQKFFFCYKNITKTTLFLVISKTLLYYI